MFSSCMNFTEFRVWPLNETPKLATSPQAKLVGCDAIVLCHEQWTCASCEHLPPRISLLSPLKPMLQRGLCTWTWRISDMNRAARWLIHVPSSYQILPACLSCLLITTTQIIKLLQKLRMSWIGWCIRYIFCFGGWILWWKPPPPKKKTAIQATTVVVHSRPVGPCRIPVVSPSAQNFST